MSAIKSMMARSEGFEPPTPRFEVLFLPFRKPLAVHGFVFRHRIKSRKYRAFSWTSPDSLVIYLDTPQRYLDGHAPDTGRPTMPHRKRPKKGPQRLTDAIAKRLPSPAKDNEVTYDTEVSGFGIRVTATGSRAFILNYVTKAGRERRYTIGRFPNWSTTAGRAKARELRRLIDDGGDPLADIEAERAAPAVVDLIERFEREHLPRLRASSQADYKRMIENHIRPHFGRHLKVADVRF